VQNRAWRRKGIPIIIIQNLFIVLNSSKLENIIYHNHLNMERTYSTLELRTMGRKELESLFVKCQSELKKEKVKNTRLKAKYQAMRKKARTQTPKVPLVKEVPRSRGVCPFCEARAPYMPPNHPCWIRTPDFQNWINLTEADREDARERLSVNTVCPESLEECSDKQKRLICYLKVFRFFYEYGEKGNQIPHPTCIVMKIRKTWPEGWEDLEFDFLF